MSTANPPQAKTPVRGLENVVAGETRVSHVDGVNGLLVYSGYDVHELAAATTFDEVVHLLWYNRLPNRQELATLRARLVGEMRLPSQVIRMIQLAPAGAHPMDVLRTAVSSLSMFDPDAGNLSTEANERKMIRLLASPFGAVMLSGVIVFTALFPLTRERYERIQRLLERKRKRAMAVK